MHERDQTTPDSIPVQITCRGNVMRLQYAGSQAFAGLLVSNALTRLTREHSITLTASLAAPMGRQFASSKRYDNYIRVRTLRVIVYGFKHSRDTVRNILDQEDLFLQRPEDSEYDRRVKYFNPMYFTRPGEDTPRMLDGSTTVSSGNPCSASDGDELNETQKGRVLRIFDEASGSGASHALEVEQSPRIISTLKE